MKKSLNLTYLTIKQFILDGFGWVIVAYFTLVAIYLIFFVVRKDSTMAFFTRNFDRGYGSSFSASFLEDILVFFLLGSIVAIVSIRISQKKPESYDYITRIGAVLNSNAAFGDADLLSFVDRELKSLLGFNQMVKVFISLEEYRQDDEAYRIYTELTHHIANACTDIKYNPFTPPRVKVASDIEVDGDYGYIKQLRTFSLKGNSTITSYIERSIHILNKPTFNEDIELAIDGNDKIGWEVYYSIWHKVRTPEKIDCYTVSVSRYTQSIEVTIENKEIFDRTINYTVNLYRYKENSSTPIGRQITLKKGTIRKVHKFENLKLYPNDRLEFYFNSPELKLIAKL